MGKQRKIWATDTKEQIVLAVLSGQLSVAEAVRQHGVNESLIHAWKAQFLEAGRARVLGRTAPVWGLPASLEIARKTGTRRWNARTND